MRSGSNDGRVLETGRDLCQITTNMRFELRPSISREEEEKVKIDEIDESKEKVKIEEIDESKVTDSKLLSNTFDASKIIKNQQKLCMKLVEIFKKMHQEKYEKISTEGEEIGKGQKERAAKRAAEFDNQGNERAAKDNQQAASFDEKDNAQELHDKDNAQELHDLDAIKHKL